MGERDENMKRIRNIVGYNNTGIKIIFIKAVGKIFVSKATFKVAISNDYGYSLSNLENYRLLSGAVN